MAAPRYNPQLATLTKTPPSGDQWIHEIKLDGYRVGCLVTGGRVRLISRNGLDWTPKFPEIAEAIKALGAKEALIDGELVVMQPDGRTSFEAMQNAAASRSARSGLLYFAFDLLHLEGEQIDRLPLEDRKERLRALVGRSTSGRIRYAEHFEGRGEDVFDQACRMGLEGIVSKRRDLPHHAGRRDTWRKTKCLQRGLFVIGGFTDQEGSQNGLGALLVGAWDGTRLAYCGRVGTGFTHSFAVDLRRTLEAITQRTPPFDPLPPATLVRSAHWVKPTMVCEVTFIEKTSAGMLRAPSFQGITRDVKARDVVLRA
jgi:bifunctional non-homologous end joining protein LigD